MIGRIREIFESVLRQVEKRVVSINGIDPGRLLMAMAVFYLAEVIRNKENN